MAIVVAVAGAGDVVEGGLRGILRNAPDLEVMDDFPHFGVIPDVVVYDVIASVEDDGEELFCFIDRQESSVVVVGRVARPDLAARAMARGAAAYVSLEADEADILNVVRKAAGQEPGHDKRSFEAPDLGADADLSPQEVALLSGVVLGYSNKQIAEQMRLSPNTVKTYVRSAYRKIGVTTRSQAVNWCLQRGFDPGVTSVPVDV